MGGWIRLTTLGGRYEAVPSFSTMIHDFRGIKATLSTALSIDVYVQRLTLCEVRASPSES